MKRENYRRYGGKGPKRIRVPKWVKELPENAMDWTEEQSHKEFEWQADYFENFGHGAYNPYYAAQMRLCCRLIDIICWGGDNGQYRHSFRKYVNTRNANRFANVPTWDRAYLHGEKQKLRYQKAYALLFKILFENVMKWWD